MKKLALYSALILAIVLGCKTKNTTDSKRLDLTFEPKSSSTVSGTATFIEQNGKVTFTANIAGLKPGVHAIHIHEKSDCSAPDASSAGGHWNPTFQNHGRWGQGQYHKGDIGNFTADASGNGTISLTTDQWCIGCDDKTKDILGKGLIVHEGADDFATQPTGNAGGRIACTAIIK